MNNFHKKIVIICFVLSLVMCIKNGNSQERIVRINLFKGLDLLPIFMGITKNYFQEEKLRINPVEIPSPSQSMEALKRGNINFAILPSTKAFLEGQRGFDLKILSCISSGSNASVWSRKLKKIEDLKGLAVVAGSLYSIDTVFAMRALENLGVERRSYDVIVSPGPPKSPIEVAENKRAGAVIVPRGWYVGAKERNLTNLLDLKDLLADFPSLVVVAKQGWVRENKNLVEKFLMGQVKSQWFMNYNLNETVKISGKIFPKKDPKFLEDFISYAVVNKLIPVTADVEPEAYKEGMNLFVKYGLVKESVTQISQLLDKIVDVNPLRAAKENLCKRCWKLPSCPPK